MKSCNLTVLLKRTVSKSKQTVCLLPVVEYSSTKSVTKLSMNKLKLAIYFDKYQLYEISCHTPFKDIFFK